MSDQSHSSGSSNAGAFVLAGAVLALAVVVWIVFGGLASEDQPDVSITVPGVGSVEGNVSADG